MSSAPDSIHGDDALPSTPDLHTTGDRIERLLEASDASGPAVRERSEELVRLVVDLYGAGLERLLEIAHEAGVLTDDVLEAVAADELVSGLLLVHGLHPLDVEERVGRALEAVRAKGDEVDFLEITDEGVVRLEIPPASGCGSSTSASTTLENAILAAAPELSGVDISSAPVAAVIPLDSLTVRLRSSPASASV